MSRILVIDPVSPFGHEAFVRKQILRFLELGFAVDMVAAEGYFSNLQLPSCVKLLPVQASYFQSSGSIGSRLQEMRLLRMLKRRAESGDYDFVVLTAFDEIALYFSGLKERLVLVAHATVAALDHPVKRIFVKQVAQRAKLVVFHEFIKRRCGEFGIFNVSVEPQGLPPAFERNADDIAKLGAIDARLASGSFRHIVFVPAGSKYGHSLMADAEGNPRMQKLLTEHQVLLVIKGNHPQSTHSNVLHLGPHLEKEQFRALFMISTCVVLAYPGSFIYRSSAQLFECFGNSKPCLLSNIESFQVYGRHFNYDPFFSDIDGLMAGIERVCSLEAGTAAAPYKDLEELEPRFDFMVNSNPRTRSSELTRVQAQSPVVSGKE